MFRASRYWKFVRIDATSQCIVQNIQPVKLFYRQLFAELPEQVEVQKVRDVVSLQTLWLKWHRLINWVQLTEARSVDLWFTSLVYRLTYLLIVGKLDQWIQRQLLTLQQDQSFAPADRFTAELSL